jgi:hypothetical protein
MAWHPVPTALALATAGFACAAVWHSCRDGQAMRLSWLVAAALLPILALNTLMALDVLAILVLRGVAQQQGWYGLRRAIQVLALLVATGSAAVAWHRLRRLGLRPAPGQRWLLLGLGLLVAVSLLRAVSLHATDQLIGVRMAGLSLGRFIDIAGLGSVGTGIALALRSAQS